MESAQNLLIIKLASGKCEIVPSDRLENRDNSDIVAQWGPFSSPQEAIARRVGLIRAGKCQPN